MNNNCAVDVVADDDHDHDDDHDDHDHDHDEKDTIIGHFGVA